MIETEERDQHRPHRPALPAEKGEPDDHQQRHPGDPAVPAADERVHDVAAVELPDRQQIEKRHEEPEPTCQCDRMQQDGRVGGRDSEGEAREAR